MNKRNSNNNNNKNNNNNINNNNNNNNNNNHHVQRQIYSIIHCSMDTIKATLRYFHCNNKQMTTNAKA